MGGGLATTPLGWMKKKEKQKRQKEDQKFSVILKWIGREKS